MANLPWHYLIICCGITLSVNASKDLPDLELLEFLADWRTEEGVWIEEEQLLKIPKLNIESEDKNTDEHN